ncbi:hypothetical protein ACHAXT_008568 [Thalassiosira profunda]
MEGRPDPRPAAAAPSDGRVQVMDAPPPPLDAPGPVAVAVPRLSWQGRKAPAANAAEGGLIATEEAVEPSDGPAFSFVPLGSSGPREDGPAVNFNDADQAGTAGALEQINEGLQRRMDSQKHWMEGGEDAEEGLDDIYVDIADDPLADLISRPIPRKVNSVVLSAGTVSVPFPMKKEASAASTSLASLQRTSDGRTPKEIATSLSAARRPAAPESKTPAKKKKRGRPKKTKKEEKAATPGKREVSADGSTHWQCAVCSEEFVFKSAGVVKACIANHMRKHAPKKSSTGPPADDAVALANPSKAPPSAPRRATPARASARQAAASIAVQSLSKTEDGAAGDVAVVEGTTFWQCPTCYDEFEFKNPGTVKACIANHMRKHAPEARDHRWTKQGWKPKKAGGAGRSESHLEEMDVCLDVAETAIEPANRLTGRDAVELPAKKQSKKSAKKTDVATKVGEDVLAALKDEVLVNGFANWKCPKCSKEFEWCHAGGMAASMTLHLATHDSPGTKSKRKRERALKKAEKASKKRGPGRPAKSAAPAVTFLDEPFQPGAAPAKKKRGRGRPRKNPAGLEKTPSRTAMMSAVTPTPPKGFVNSTPSSALVGVPQTPSSRPRRQAFVDACNALTEPKAMDAAVGSDSGIFGDENYPLVAVDAEEPVRKSKRGRPLRKSAKQEESERLMREFDEESSSDEEESNWATVPSVLANATPSRARRHVTAEASTMQVSFAVSDTAERPPLQITPLRFGQSDARKVFSPIATTSPHEASASATIPSVYFQGLPSSAPCAELEEYTPFSWHSSGGSIAGLSETDEALLLMGSLGDSVLDFSVGSSNGGATSSTPMKGMGGDFLASPRKRCGVFPFAATPNSMNNSRFLTSPLSESPTKRKRGHEHLA